MAFSNSYYYNKYYYNTTTSSNTITLYTTSYQQQNVFQQGVEKIEKKYDAEEQDIDGEDEGME